MEHSVSAGAYAKANETFAVCKRQALDSNIRSGWDEDEYDVSFSERGAERRVAAKLRGNGHCLHFSDADEQACTMGRVIEG